MKNHPESVMFGGEREKWGPCLLSPSASSRQQLPLLLSASTRREMFLSAFSTTFFSILKGRPLSLNDSR